MNLIFTKYNPNNYTHILLFLITLSFLLGNAAINILSLFFLLISLTNYKKIIKPDFFSMTLLGFFIFLIILNLFLDPYDPIESIKILKYVILTIFIISNQNLNNEIINKYINLVKFLLIFIAIDTLYQYLFGYDLLGLTVPEIHKPRLTGPFIDGIPVPGVFIAYFSPLVLIKLLEDKKFVQLFLIIILFYICILLTGERMAVLLFLFTSLIILFFCYSVNKKIFLISIFALFFISFNLFIFNSYINYRVLSIFSFLDFNNFLNSHYGSHYITSIKIISDNFFFGSGFDNFKFLCSEIKYSNQYDFNELRCSTHTHNIYLQTLQDFGIFSFIIFLVILAYPIYKFVKQHSLKKIFILNKYSKFLVILIIILIPFKSTGDLFATWYGGIFWLLYAISIVFLKNQSK